MSIQKDIALPKGINADDLKYPQAPKNLPYKKYSAWMQGKGKLVEPRELMFYFTERFGWCITTLFISRGKNGSDRFYGVKLDGGCVSMGNGPHVLKQVHVYLRASRLKDLQQFIDTYNTGLKLAHGIRDSISTRRSNTAARRMNYRSIF